MDITDLIKKLKKMKVINSLVGEFSFIKQIGEGGNSNVCLYKKNDIDFAVKFFSKGTENSSKTKRFIDEYFGMAQVPSHPNIAEYLHLDTVTIDEEKYLIIIMKVYESTLDETLAEETDQSVYTDKLRALYEDLLDAIEHLHAHGIMHRDIKPQNILIDGVKNGYVLSDFGISKFAPESIAKEAETRDGERLANYRYCAPEQRGKIVPASFSSDLYSFAQVIQEYATGDINHGGGRTQVKFQDVELLRIIDKVITICLMHNPDDRFKSVAQLKEYMIKESEKFKTDMRQAELERYNSNSWDYLYKLNIAIARGFPRVRGVGEITDVAKMVRFFNCIDETIKSDEHTNNLWMIKSDGGDLNYFGAKHIIGNEFEINFGSFPHQTRINKILVYYDDTRPYRNFFIILVDPMHHFDFVNTADLSQIKIRGNYPTHIDYAVVWNDLHLDPQDAQNLYIEIEDNVYEKNSDAFREIYRYVAFEALLVSPNNVIDRHINQNALAKILLKKCISQNTLNMDSVREYWNGVGGHYNNWISSRL